MKLKPVEEAKDVLDEIEDFSYTQLEGEQVEIKIVKPSSMRGSDEAS